MSGEHVLIKHKIQRALKLMRGKNRICLGFCPMCNSDAPEVYDCPICNGYQSASGDKYPPLTVTKAVWWQAYKKALDASLMVKKLVAQSKAK